MISINLSVNCAPQRPGKKSSARPVSDDLKFMSMALALGRRGLGRTWPNPSVGCVIVAGGRVVGRGRTGDGGRPHAEVLALQQAGSLARGATAYVTLEPCSHFGKTPPCTEALINAGIVRVVGALDDQDPRVNGTGFEQLRKAGIEVVTGLGQKDAAEDHQGFVNRLTKKRPFLTLKMATSFDGRIGTASGQSQWITAPQARNLVHAMRARHDAVMVGGETARKDNPSLTVRGLGIRHETVRIIVSRKLDLPPDSLLAQSAQSAPLWLCHGPDAPQERVKIWSDLGAKLISCRIKSQMIDISDMMEQLTENGLTRVFCEGGGALAASLIESDSVDELIGFNAGLLIGAEGQPAIGALGVQDLSKAPRFALSDVKKIGPDIMHIWRRRP